LIQVPVADRRERGDAPPERVVQPLDVLAHRPRSSHPSAWDSSRSEAMEKSTVNTTMVTTVTTMMRWSHHRGSLGSM
jgi:hypothetical protein